MKKLKYMILLVPILLVTSCSKKDSEGISSVTYYPTFKVSGASVIQVVTGTAFTDPGVSATENGKTLPVTISITGDYFPFTGSQIDATTPNKYDITYSAVNKDGFTGSVARSIYVVTTGDLVSSIEGLYTSTVARNGASAPKYTDMAYVMIRKTGTNTYELSDDIGAYYDIGRIYGATYRATGIIVTATDIPSNTFTYAPTVPVGAFGGVLTMKSFSVDPGTKTIKFETDWDAGYNFVVTLTQVKI